MIQRESPVAPRHRRSSPVRMCLGCRKRELAVELLRVVAVSMGNGRFGVSVDASGRHPGRGAWLHPDGRCLSAAIRRRAFASALRISDPPDTSVVVEYFRELPGSAGRPGEEQAAEEHEHTVKSRR